MDRIHIGERAVRPALWPKGSRSRNEKAIKTVETYLSIERSPVYGEIASAFVSIDVGESGSESQSIAIDPGDDVLGGLAPDPHSNDANGE